MMPRGMLSTQGCQAINMPNWTSSCRGGKLPVSKGSIDAWWKRWKDAAKPARHIVQLRQT